MDGLLGGGDAMDESSAALGDEAINESSGALVCRQSVDATERPPDAAAPPAEGVSMGGERVDAPENPAESPAITSPLSEEQASNRQTHVKAEAEEAHAAPEHAAKRRSTRDPEGAAADKKARVKAERLDHDAVMCAPFPDRR